MANYGALAIGAPLGCTLRRGRPGASGAPRRCCRSSPSGVIYGTFRGISQQPRPRASAGSPVALVWRPGTGFVPVALVCHPKRAFTALPGSTSVTFRDNTGFAG